MSKNMSVMAKFKVYSKTEYDNGTEVTLEPVYSEDPNSENKKFWDYTPNGKITMFITKGKPAIEAFIVGQEMYVEFNSANPEDKQLIQE